MLLVRRARSRTALERIHHYREGRFGDGLWRCRGNGQRDRGVHEQPEPGRRPRAGARCNSFAVTECGSSVRTDARVEDLTLSTNCLSGVRVAATSFGTLVQNTRPYGNGNPTAPGTLTSSPFITRLPIRCASPAAMGYFESDAGATWRSPSAGLEAGYLRSVAIDPSNQTSSWYQPRRDPTRRTPP